MLSWLVLAQEIEKDIESVLTPMGPFIPQPFPWEQIFLAVGIFTAVVFFFLYFLPKVAGNALRFGGVLGIFAAALLSVFLPFTLHALRSPTKTLIKASPGTVPKNVVVTGTTAESFTVEWETQSESIGMIKYGTTADELNFFALDEKGNLPTKTHRVTVKNLKPKTRYFFEVVSGQLRFNDAKQPLETKTL